MKRAAVIGALAVGLCGALAIRDAPGLSPVPVAIDGDTIRVGAERIRLIGIDTPEIRGKCADEKRRARDAKARMAALIASADLHIERHGRDRYGRTLAVVSVTGKDIAGIMISEGLAVTWAGKRHRWCQP